MTQLEVQPSPARRTLARLRRGRPSRRAQARDDRWHGREDRGPGPRLHAAGRTDLASECRLPAGGRPLHRPHVRGRQQLDRHAGDQSPSRRGNLLETLCRRRPLAGLWKLDDAPGDTVANGSEYEAPVSRHGNVTLQSPDRHGKPAAARFQGGAQIVVGEHRAVHLQARSRASPSRPGSRPRRRRTRSSPRGPARIRSA